MKKVLSVLLALIMIFALFACNAAPATPSATPSAAASASPSAAPSSAAPSASASAAPSEPAKPIDVTTTADETGFFKSGVDPASRKTYNITYMYPFQLLLFVQMEKCFDNYSKTLNFKMTSNETQGDMDKFIQNIETFADQGTTDGFVVVIDPSVSERIIEVLDNTKIPYVGFCNSVRDTTGSEIVPAVGLDSGPASAATVQWLFDNYSKYWGDKVDPSTIALINSNASINSDLNDRAVFAAKKFNELIPKNAGVYDIDLVADFTQDTAYNMSAAVFAAHPDIKYWFSTNCVEMYSQGVARAVENLNLDKKVLITDVGSDVLCSEWETNYDGCWVSCVAISNYLYAAPAISALVAMLDGKATPDSLWADRRVATDKFTWYGADSKIVTKDTYKEYFNGYAKLAGAELPYPA